MAYLIKIDTSNKLPTYFIHPLIFNLEEIKNPLKEKILILDYRNRIRIIDKQNDKKTKEKIPQFFIKSGNQICFQSPLSFQQNHNQIGKYLRKYVLNQLKTSFNKNKNLKNTLYCIGGESYIYPLFIDEIENIYFITNQKNIEEDCLFHQTLFIKKHIQTECLKNYLSFPKLLLNKEIYKKTILINLAQIPTFLWKELNKMEDIEEIFLIHCHIDDFLKKRKVLDNFKIKERKHFTCWKLNYTISFTHFIKK